MKYYIIQILESNLLRSVDLVRAHPLQATYDMTHSFWTLGGFFIIWVLTSGSVIGKIRVKDSINENRSEGDLSAYNHGSKTMIDSESLLWMTIFNLWISENDAIIYVFNRVE